MRSPRRHLFRTSCLALGLMAAGSLLFAAPARADEDEALDYELMKLFVDTFEKIERNYVTDIDRRELTEAAIEGMINRLDQYSSYISPEDLKHFNQTVEQEFGGIGIQVTEDEATNQLTVMTPLPGTPAYKAGVRAGDVITKIEGESTDDYKDGIKVEMAVKILKGKPGDPVNIEVRHLDGTIEEIHIVRDIIHVATVLGDRYDENGEWEFMLDKENKIAYVRLTHFSRHSAEEMRRALEKLTAQGMRALILDLRINPGGLLSQAVEIADLFVDDSKYDGLIVSTKGRNTPEQPWKATRKDTYSDFPMAILVNRYSASASEIVSACLQDHGRAVIVGERTWGKGSVQNIIEVEDGKSALKLTTASYHRPSGKNIHKLSGAKESDDWGVRPEAEFKLKMTNDELRKYLEYRQDRDVLSKEGPGPSDSSDRQLALALSHVHKQLGIPAAKDETKEGDDKQSKAVPAKQPAALDQSSRKSKHPALERPGIAS